MMEENAAGKKIVGSERNYGIDALRMTAMFLVLITHILLAGGVLEPVDIMELRRTGFFSQYMAAWFLEIAGCCAVDCYALISGYVGAGKRYRYTGFVMLWLRAVFYCVAAAALFSVFLPDRVGLRQWILAFFPVLGRSYWYFTAYAGLFVFIPVLNTAMMNMGKKQHAAVLIGAAVLFSIAPFVLNADIFITNTGYSVWWLMVLYLAGGYIRLYGLFPKIGSGWMFLGYFVMVILLWCYKIGCALNYFQGGYEINYIAPPVVCSAICMLLAFERLHFSGTAKKVIRFFAPLSFSVYLIHTQPLLWGNLLAGSYNVWTIPSAVGLVAFALGTAVVFYVGCSLIDYFREKLFVLLRIKERLTALEERARGGIL